MFQKMMNTFSRRIKQLKDKESKKVKNKIQNKTKIKSSKHRREKKLIYIYTPSIMNCCVTQDQTISLTDEESKK